MSFEMFELNGNGAFDSRLSRGHHSPSSSGGDGDTSELSLKERMARLGADGGGISMPGMAALPKGAVALPGMGMTDEDPTWLHEDWNPFEIITGRL